MLEMTYIPCRIESSMTTVTSVHNNIQNMEVILLDSVTFPGPIDFKIFMKRGKPWKQSAASIVSMLQLGNVITT